VIQSLLVVLLLGQAANLQQDVQDPPANVTRRDDETPRLRPPPPEGTTIGTPSLLERASATITVITGADLQSLGVRFLSDAFRVAPGMEVTRMSSTEANVSLRGYNDDTSASQGVMALLDRRQVYNEFLGNVVWEALPVSLYEIDRIEILRGPGSFLYGPNAMHGLVNFITRSPMAYFRNGTEPIPDPQEVWLRVEAGSYRSNTESVIYVHREGDTAIRFKVGHDDINEFSPSTQDAKNKVFGEVKLETWIDGPDHRVEATLGIVRQSFNVLIPTFSILPPATFDTSSTEPYAKINYDLGGLRNQISWTRFDATGIPEHVYAPFHVISDVADLDLQWTGRFGENEVTLGTGYRYATFITENQSVSGERHSTGLGWVFAQDQWAIARNAWITAGLRVDDHSRSGISLSPRLAFVWEFDTPTPLDPKAGNQDSSYGQSLRATMGYGHRNPSLRELWFNMPVEVPNPGSPPPTLPGRILGNPDLKPEQMRSFEVGYWGRPLAYLQIECNLYYNLVDRLVQYEQLTAPSTLPVDFGPRNVNKDRAYGGELNIEAQIGDDVFAFANFSYAIRQDRDTGVRNPSAPRIKSNAGLRYDQGGIGWGAMAWATFTDQVDYLDPLGGFIGRADAYAMLNARVAHGFKLGKSEGKVYLQAFNLTNNRHWEHAEGDRYGILAMLGAELAW